MARSWQEHGKSMARTYMATTVALEIGIPASARDSWPS
jgi:hypothetical protein